jgi:hypothetical protein
MSLVVELKSNDVVEVALDLPSKPTDASETNSAWQVKDHGRLSFWKGECFAQALKSAYMDALFLVHRMPESVQPNGHVARGELVYGVTLCSFFGFDGGIREKRGKIRDFEVRAFVAFGFNRLGDSPIAKLCEKSGGSPIRGAGEP